VSAQSAALDVSARAAIVLDGVERVVEHAKPQHGRVALVSAGGQLTPSRRTDV
jgi:hypothetical protein